MASTDRSRPESASSASSGADSRDEEPDGSRAIREAMAAGEFVRVIGRPAGESLVATALLVRAFEETNTPYQVRIVDHCASSVADEIPDTRDDSTSIGVCCPRRPFDVSIGWTDGSPTSAAVAVSTAAGIEPPGHLPAVGRFLSAGVAGDESAPDRTTADADDDVASDPGSAIASESDSDPDLESPWHGLGLPTDDLEGGLRCSTLVHGPFSGRSAPIAALFRGEDGTRELPTSADAIRESPTAAGAIRSLLAIETVAEESAPPRAAIAVTRLLGSVPVAADPFRTVAGYADVVDLLADRRPAAVLAHLAFDRDPESLLAEWADGAVEIHERVRSASIDEESTVVTIDDAGRYPRTVARLCRDFRTSAGVVIAAGVSAIGIAVAQAHLEDMRSALRSDEPEEGSPITLRPDGTGLVAKSDGTDDGMDADDRRDRLVEVSARVVG